MAHENQLIGRYRLLNRLGAGGMGEVWKALDTGVTQREVALKLVLSEEDPQMLHVLASEAKAMAQLPMHTNLAALLDVVEEGANLALVMEYVPGPNLRALLRNYPAGLPWAVIHAVAEGLLHGLEHAHGHHVIHRDLKPENIKLLSIDGSKPLKPNQVKILDFGLARAEKEQSTRFTRGASGTFAYMAPEQLTGQAQTEGTDLYALGILLFEMACGGPPFGGPGKESFGAIYQGHTAEPPPLPSMLRADAPPEFDQAILRTLARQASLRPRSAEELADFLLPMLARLAQDQTLTVPEATVGRPPLDQGSRPASSPPRTPLPPQAPSSGQGQVTVIDARPEETASSQVPIVPLSHDEVVALDSVLPTNPPPSIGLGSDTDQHQNKKRTSRTELLWPATIGALLLLGGGLAFGIRGRTPSKAPYPTGSTTPSQNGQEVLTNSVGMRFRFCPPGSFLMGSPLEELQRIETEGPQHQVTFRSGFWICETDVTVGQFREFVQETGYLTEAEKGDGAYVWTDSQWEKRKDACWNHSYLEQTEDHPVVCVNRNDTLAFIRWLSSKGDGVYRLPSEAEHEYSCRAGTVTPFNTGNVITTDQANFDGHHQYSGSGQGVNRLTTTPTKAFPANAWGLFDLHGNIYRWCEDTWHENYSGAPDDGIAWMDGDPGRRVLRGSSFHISAEGSRSAARIKCAQTYRSNSLGFRVVMARVRSQ